MNNELPSSGTKKQSCCYIIDSVGEEFRLGSAGMISLFFMFHEVLDLI